MSVGSLRARLALAVFLALSSGTPLVAQRPMPRPVVRDSAGIRIVEYSTLGPMPPMWAMRGTNPLEQSLQYLPAAIRVAPTPYLDIGGVKDDEREEFNAQHSMFTVAELSNGTIVINDRVQLKYFTRDGKFIRAVGRSGRGPGEFSQTREVCALRGDTVLAVNLDHRMSLWNASGEHLRTLARVGEVLPKSCTADGTVIVRDATVATKSRESSADNLMQYRIVRSDGAVVRVLDRLPGPVSAGFLFRVPTIVRIGSDLLIAGARTYELQLQSPERRVRWISRTGRPRLSISDQEWSEHTRHTIPRNSGAENEKRIRELMAWNPGFYPAYSHVFVDPTGRIWVQDFQSHGRYTLFDRNGLLLGRFELAGAGLGSRRQLIGVAADHLIVLDDDSDGAVHIKFYRILTAAQTGSSGS